MAARLAVLGNPRTVYGRGGGVFGLARVCDALMDAWMADPVLNANEKVGHPTQATRYPPSMGSCPYLPSRLPGRPARLPGRERNRVVK